MASSLASVSLLSWHHYWHQYHLWCQHHGTVTLHSTMASSKYQHHDIISSITISIIADIGIPASNCITSLLALASLHQGQSWHQYCFQYHGTFVSISITVEWVSWLHCWHQHQNIGTCNDSEFVWNWNTTDCKNQVCTYLYSLSSQ